ncbi:Uncharacterized protein APZ42_009526 [Daphnia magna]|uniref:Uncharacterized protein n=1 Tax=Daphnia magna TaxID=35525 RepID=A0A164DYH4_9CRUS|nr:Uncharacterized protein APZ42_009526 [Daphnia magna]
MVRSSASSVPLVQDPPPSAPSQLPGQEIPQEPTLQPDGGLMLRSMMKLLPVLRFLRPFATKFQAILRQALLQRN